MTELYDELNKEADTTILEDGENNAWFILAWRSFRDGEHHLFERLAKQKAAEKLWDDWEDLVK